MTTTKDQDKTGLLMYRGITYFPWPVWSAHRDKLIIMKTSYTFNPMHGMCLDSLDNGEKSPDLLDEHHIACAIPRDDNLTGELLSKIELVLNSVAHYDPLNFSVNTPFIVEHMSLIKEHAVPVIESIFDHYQQRKE